MPSSAVIAPELPVSVESDVLLIPGEEGRLADGLTRAVEWLTDVATVRDGQPVGERGKQMPFKDWNGAIRGEYRVATAEWDSFCPIWHTGQAVKALVMAAAALDRPDLLAAARINAGFLMANRITEGPDRGLILAVEDHPDKVNTSAILECLDGLFVLSEATGDTSYAKAALEALVWVRDHAWDASRDHFHDIYDFAHGEFRHGVRGAQGRPLLDDAVFLKGWRLTGDESFREVAVRTAETLLRDEEPAGNWIAYIPCNKIKGSIHPRHAYWWGRPMLEVFRATGDERFRECFERSVQWYKGALRRDGGFIRNTYSDFSTDCFGHATSGAACAALVFLDHWELTADRSSAQHAARALEYCLGMQFTRPQDPNLAGCILEKVLPPDGTDRSPFQIRDLGTIFFVQAAAQQISISMRQSSP